MDRGTQTPAEMPGGRVSTESAEQGASFEASVGAMTTGVTSLNATALPASTHSPPPTARTQDREGFLADLSAD